jgi:hypothetical protein
LREIEPARRAGEAAALGDADERAQLAELDPLAIPKSHAAADHK